jgi:murein DD-endopeptidase MepM/ murein hydrolase activator NlpD
MSSLHQDHLLVEGPETATAAGSPLAPARGSSRRPTAEKVSNRVPAQRQGKAQSSGTTTTTADGPVTTSRPKRSTPSKAAGTIAARAKAAKSATTRAASSKAATATAATVRAASAKAATAGAATGMAAGRAASKAATAAKTAAAAKVAARTSPVTKAAAKPAATKPAATKPTATKPAAKPATATPAPAKVTAAKVATKKVAAPVATVAATPAVPAPRPTPYRRPRPAEAPVLVAEPVAPTAVEATDVVAAATAGRVHRLLRRPPSVRRRPALYLAAALVASLGLSGLSTTGPTAQATDTMNSISVAQELGIDSSTTDAVIDPADTERLGELAASRNERGAAQAAAAEAQAEADQAATAAAAEAARPKAVLPVNGARLTSGFGARWGTLHAGTDFAAPIGTPEYAVMDGVVLKAGPASGFGLAVYIQHANGDVTVYGHMEQILVQEGQVVKAGETIALLGNRGQSTGPHLHLEVHVGGLNGQKIDPLPWLREHGVSV